MTAGTSTAKGPSIIVELRAESVVRWIANRRVPLTLSQECQQQMRSQIGMTPAQLDSVLTLLIETETLTVRPGMAGLVVERVNHTHR